MKKNVVVRGQMSFFDFIEIPACSELKTAIPNFNSLDEFDLHYTGYAPSSFDELCTIVNRLGELIRTSYVSYLDKDIEVTGLTIRHYLVHEGWDVYNYGIDWYIQKRGNTDVTKRVHCNVERLSPSSDSYWRIGDTLTYTASAHTSKKCCNGKTLANDKSIFCDRLSDITKVSFELLDGMSVTVRSAKKKARERLSPVQKFFNDYNGVVIEDCITVTGDDFKSFCRKLKNALKKEAQEKGYFDDIIVHPGHYDLRGFMLKHFEDGDRYIYWSYSVMRGDMPTYLDKRDCEDGFLYRTAKDSKDYTGGYNHFTDLRHLLSEAYELMISEKRRGA